MLHDDLEKIQALLVHPNSPLEKVLVKNAGESDQKVIEIITKIGENAIFELDENLMWHRVDKDQSCYFPTLIDAVSSLIHAQTNSETECSYLSDSCADIREQFSQIQDQILSQGHQIENYIIEHSKMHSRSPAFNALTTLFSLFKKQLSITITVRRALLIEKESSRSEHERLKEAKQEISSFLDNLSEISGRNIENFDTATQLITDTLSAHSDIQKYQILLENSHNLQEENHALELRIKTLQTQLQESQAQSVLDACELRQEVDNQSSSISHLRSHLLSVEEENRVLKSRISRIEEEKKQAESDFALKQAELNSAKRPPKHNYDDLLREMSKIEARYKKMSLAIEELRKEKRNVELRELSAKKELESIKLDMARLQKENDFNVVEIQKTREKISKLKAEKKALKERFVISSYTERKIPPKPIDLTPKYGKILQQLQQVEEQNSLLRSENAKLSSQIRVASRTIEKLESSSQSICQKKKQKEKSVIQLTGVLQVAKRDRQNVEQVEACFEALKEGLGLDQDMEPREVAKEILIHFRPIFRAYQSPQKKLVAKIDSLQSELEELRNSVM